MKRILLVLSIYLFYSNAFCAEYAILISGGMTTTPNTLLNSEYWNDLFLAYEDLVLKEGYSPANIFVFYGDGNSYNSTLPRYNIALHNWSNIVNFDNNYNTLNTQFANIGNIITSNDNLVIRWLVGHGGGNSSTANTVTGSATSRSSINNDDYWVYLENRNLWIRETEIIRIINQIPNYKRRKIFWMTCHSGCIASGFNNLNNTKTVIFTSSGWDSNSSSTFDLGGVVHAALNYSVTSSLYGYEPSGEIYNYFIDPFGEKEYFTVDTNADSVINMKELFDHYRFRFNNSCILGDIGDLADKIYVDEHLVFENTYFQNNIHYKVEDFIFQNNNTITNNSNIIINVDNAFEINTSFEIPFESNLEVNIQN